MANILLGVTGSVAAIRTPDLYDQFIARGHAVKIVATDASQYFFDPAKIGQPDGRERNRDVVTVDEDEWPGKRAGQLYERDQPVVHIELRRWADVFVIAPLDANTLAKMANGLADNCLTCVWRAWDTNRPILLAPAMNTLMWEHPATARHLIQLAADAGINIPAQNDTPTIIQSINAQAGKLRIISPQSKKLACEDIGMGAMAEVQLIVDEVEHILTS